MDIQKYIQSGILEDYVLGLVSDKEALVIEQNIIQYPELKAELHQIEDALASYAQAKAMPISLKGTDKAPNAETIVYFNPSAEKSYLDIGTLPAAPSDKDYQLWALIDRQPTDMGIINLTIVNGLIEVPVIPNAQAFAITLEARDGNPAPNLEELFVIGKV